MKYIASVLALAVVIVGCQATSAEPRATLTSGDYALLVGPWEGEWISETMEGYVTWESNLKLDVFKSGNGRFSEASRNLKWRTKVKIERGMVILNIGRGAREFIYTKKGNTATLSTIYEGEWEGDLRVVTVMLKKRIGPSQ